MEFSRERYRPRWAVPFIILIGRSFFALLLAQIIRWRYWYWRAQHGDGETFRFEIAVPIGPRTIHLITLDRGNGHQGST
jgi:hypothetical protein